MAIKYWFPTLAMVLAWVLSASELRALDSSAERFREPPAPASPMSDGSVPARHQHAAEELAEATADFDDIPLWFGTSSGDIGVRAQIVARMCRMARYDESVLSQVAHLATAKAKQRIDIRTYLRALNVLILTRCLFKVPVGKHNPSKAGEVLWPLSVDSRGQLLITGSWSDGGGVASVAEGGAERDFIDAQKRYGLRHKPGAADARH